MRNLTGSEMQAQTPQTFSRPATERAVVIAVGLLLAAASVWLSLTRFEYGQNADSIVPALVSLQHWTPYFWDTNRYGMLLPLLAAPLRNPLANLLFQAAVGIFAGMSSSFLLVRYFFDDSYYWLSAAALQNIWLLLLVPPYTRFDWLVVQCYGMSFFLAFTGLLLLRKKRWVAATALLLLASWVNAATFVLVLPLVVARHLVLKRKQGLLPALAVVAASGAAGIWFSHLVRFQTTTPGIAPVSSWTQGWRQDLAYFPGGSFKLPLLSLWVLIPALFGLIRLVLTRKSKRALWTCAALLVCAVTYVAAIDTLAWVQLSDYGMRFVYPSILLLSLAAAILAVAPFADRLAKVQWVPAAAAALLFVATLSYGPPSASGIRQWLHARYGGMTADIVQSKALLVAGNYWTVWPAVFDANLALRQQGQQRQVYGLTYRYQGSARKWSRLTGFCVAIVPHDPDSLPYLYHLRPYELQQSYPTVDLYCPR